MTKLSLLLATLLATATAVQAADTFEVRGSASALAVVSPHLDRIRDRAGIDLQVTPVRMGRAMLDLADGRTDIVLIAVPLMDAVAAAREAAWMEGRVIAVPPLDYRPLDGADGVGFVSRQGMQPRLARLLPVASRVAESAR